MRIFIYETSDQAAERAAAEILAALERKPDLVLGLATGSTPIGVYARLIRAHRERGTDFSRVRSFNLDEYLDLGPGHPQSYRAFMRRNLFEALNIPERHIHFPPSEGGSLLERCERYEEEIRAAGGIDIQLLGIGTNSHIGFNEPTSSLRSRTHLQTLTPKTLRDNARFYPSEDVQPRMAVTMGIGTILDARRIILQAFGPGKAEAVRTSIEGPVSSLCPGSALQLHPDVLFLLDGEASNLLSLREYYLRAQADHEDLRRAGRI